MVCLATLTLSTVATDCFDVFSMHPPKLQLYCCQTRLQYLADGAVHDLDYLPYLVARGAFRKIALLDFPKYEYSGRLSGNRKSLKAIPARIYSVDTISQ